jgi:hypothetical protein
MPVLFMQLPMLYMPSTLIAGSTEGVEKYQGKMQVGFDTYVIANDVPWLAPLSPSFHTQNMVRDIPVRDSTIACLKAARIRVSHYFWESTISPLLCISAGGKTF